MYKQIISRDALGDVPLDGLKGLYSEAVAHAGHDHAIIERRFTAANNAATLALTILDRSGVSFLERGAMIENLQGLFAYTSANARHPHSVQGRCAKAASAAENLNAAIRALQL
ncbi:MAG: hypothetical protein GC136_00370 [Alphaproteobacteria bacterium]|nr:hypothetical protein [Alphaproteobacteria bacterium]